MNVSLQEARRLAIAAQGLDGAWSLPAGKEGAAQAIERLGFVQIDTIAVVERAHHHTLWTRCPDYRPDMLHTLLADDRRVFEYWATPAAAYVPMADYRWYLPRMLAERQSERAARWLKENRAVVRRVLDRIRREGPLGSSDFEAPAGQKRGTWWEWKPAKRALETLFDRGELMVSCRRRNFERVYDLAERILPTGADLRPPDRAEALRFGARRYLAAHGTATADEIRWATFRKPAPEPLRELLAAGEVVPLTVEGLDGQAHYALTESLEVLHRRPAGAGPLHLLSPFDSFVGRRRLRRLFGFDYKLECYVPEPRRRHGYFCLPIHWRDQLVGRLDPKADRENRCLIVRALILEPGARLDDTFLSALSRKLLAFAAFNGCHDVVIEKTCPAKIRAPLRRVLAHHPDGMHPATRAP